MAAAPQGRRVRSSRRRHGEGTSSRATVNAAVEGAINRRGPTIQVEEKTAVQGRGGPDTSRAADAARFRRPLRSPVVTRAVVAVEAKEAGVARVAAGEAGAAFSLAGGVGRLSEYGGGGARRRWMTETRTYTMTGCEHIGGPYGVRSGGARGEKREPRSDCSNVRTRPKTETRTETRTRTRTRVGAKVGAKEDADVEEVGVLLVLLVLLLVAVMVMRVTTTIAHLRTTMATTTMTTMTTTCHLKRLIWRVGTRCRLRFTTICTSTSSGQFNGCGNCTGRERGESLATKWASGKRYRSRRFSPGSSTARCWSQH